MRRRRWLAGLAAMAALGLILALVIVLGMSKDAMSPTSPQMVAFAPDSPAEGIAVHGHWVIEIKNPDGTLAERREFDNALVSGGRELLVKLLARQSSVGGWAMRLVGSPTNAGAFASEGGVVATGGGIIAESTHPSTGSYIFNNLTISTPTSGEHAGRLVLSGTATANVNGNISLVQLQIVGHAVTEVSSSTYTGTAYQIYTFSQSSVSPVPLTSGQTVTVTVAISFS